MGAAGALTTELRHQKFVDEFLRTYDTHEAYEAAGYNGKPQNRNTRIGELFSNRDVQARIRARMQQLQAEILLDHVQHAEEVCNLAYSNLRDVCTWGPEGVQVIPSEELSPAVARTVQKVTSRTRTRLVMTEAGESVPETTVEIEVALHNKVESLKLLWTMFDKAQAQRQEMEKQLDLLAQLAARYIPAEYFADFSRDVAFATGRISALGAAPAASATDVTPGG